MYDIFEHHPHDDRLDASAGHRGPAAALCNKQPAAGTGPGSDGV
jgi:hypothetical protein